MISYDTKSVSPQEMLSIFNNLTLNSFHTLVFKSSITFKINIILYLYKQNIVTKGK